MIGPVWTFCFFLIVTCPQELTTRLKSKNPLPKTTSPDTIMELEHKENEISKLRDIVKFYWLKIKVR